MKDERDMVEIWVVCKVCGESNRDPEYRKYAPLDMVERVEAQGGSLRPSTGLCDKHRITPGNSKNISKSWH